MNVYDASMKSVYQGTRKENGQEVDGKKEKKESVKSDDEENPAKQKKRKGMKV